MLHSRSVLPRPVRLAGATVGLILLFAHPGPVASGETATSNESGAKLTIRPTVFPAPDASLIPPTEAEPAGDGSGEKYQGTTHQAVTNVAVRRTDCTADSYLKDQLLMTNGIFTSTPTGQLSVRIEAGSEHEDSESWNRAFNHFFDPISHAGLHDWVTGTASLQWAYNGGGNQYDWRDARDAFYRALTQPTKSQRLTQMSSLFFDLGHVVHLVEDMAVPQHTRNDAHAVGADYEAWCTAHYGSVGAINSLPIEAIPAFGSVSSPFGGIPGEFAAFWDTGQYTGQAGFTTFAGTPGLAEYSNAYFLTDDTMFGTTRAAMLPRGAGVAPLTVRLTEAMDNYSTSANHRYPHPHIRNTNLASFYAPSVTFVTLQREGVGLTGALHYVDLTVRNTSGGVVQTIPNLFLINGSNEIGFDDVTYASCAQILLPKAVSYAAGMINYFFRGKIGLQSPTTTWNAEEKKNQIQITNDSNESFGAGTWELYYDDANGNRTRVNEFDTSAYSGLAPGASFTAKFPELLCEGGWEFTLVFKGKIGNEDDAVAGRTFYPAPETWVGTYDVPSGDPLCYGVSDQCIAIFERPTPAGYDIVGYLQFVNASDMFQVSGTCDNNQLSFGFGGDCGWALFGTVSGSTLTDAGTCCWYCPLNPPPEGPWFCGSILGMERVQ